MLTIYSFSFFLYASKGNFLFSKTENEKSSFLTVFRKLNHNVVVWKWRNSSNFVRNENVTTLRAVKSIDKAKSIEISTMRYLLREWRIEKKLAFGALFFSVWHCDGIAKLWREYSEEGIFFCFDNKWRMSNDNRNFRVSVNRARILTFGVNCSVSL